MFLSLDEAEDFSKDPYGYFTNQSGHTWDVGFLFLVYGSCVASFTFFGTLLCKEFLIVGAGLAYLVFEILVQGWKGWDTIEDWWFVNIYGVVAPVLVFTYNETTQKLEVDPLAPLPFVVLYFTHKFVGSFLRSNFKCLLK